MTITNFDIIFDENVYYVGQMVTGKVILSLNEPKTIRKVEFKLKGETSFQWSDDESYTDSDGKSQTRSVTRSGSETYFKSNIILKSDTGGTEKFVLSAGDYSFPFEIMLPTNVPSSFQGSYGGIKFYGKAKVNIPYGIDKRAKKDFNIINSLNLNRFPHLNTPVHEEKNKSFGCFCCNTGPLTLSVYIPRKGYAKYESVPITVEVNNASNVRISNISANLYRKIHWKADFDFQTQYYKLKSTFFGDVKKNSSNIFSGSILLATESYPNIENCKIITISYILEIEAHTVGLHTNLKISIPLTIGDIGFCEDTNTDLLNHTAYLQDYKRSEEHSISMREMTIPVAKDPNIYTKFRV